MIETGGSMQLPQPKSGSIRLSLQRLTAYVPRGLLSMRLGVGGIHPVAIERQAEESVFVVGRGVPHVEITGISREDELQSWLRLRGASNAYEADTTLSDPLFVVRDQAGQKTTTTLNDLIVNQPDWADERTPRWVVRWSQPLPDSVSVSRLVPADFRQDGSLFAGFQEKSLPKMPMQRTLDFSTTDLP
ncbi:serine/threonine-protein kinase pknB [Rhodopirellula sallentina SM41]|uniref:Serine/threonine-protein kinase pknB n=2 Tax=Rhodopirellula TaxID=265488 RepID=M5TVF7_9BACT|nr:serine/threonine-protein kinase pknB [Rhodopirellula sallentina SM41]